MNNKFEKPCPFCGEEGTEKYDWYVSVVHKKDCLFYEHEDDGLTTYDTTLWQSRPIEDALRKQLEGLTANSIYDRMYEAEKERDALRKQLSIAVEAIDDYTRNKSIYVLYKALAEIERIK